MLPGKKSSENGQVVLIVLLIMSVILVVGLSIASRSVTDIKISQQSQEAARALWVAQAGLEQAMKTNSAIGVGASLGGVNYSVTKAGIGGGQEFVFPGNFEQDEPATLSLEGYGGNLTFFWGKEDPPPLSDTTPALEVTLFYENGGKKTQRYVYDPYSGRNPSTNFDGHVNTASCSTGEVNFAFCSNPVPLPGSITPYFVRLKLLFNDTAQPIGVKGSASLPSQGNCFDSIATVPESGVSRKLRQCQLKEGTPSIFDYVLFSGSTIQ